MTSAGNLARTGCVPAGGAAATASGPLKAASESVRNSARSSILIPNLWDTAWILCLSDQRTVDSYIQARAYQGFNAMLVAVANWGLQNTPLGNGQAPFQADYVRAGAKRECVADVSKPSNSGFAYIDHIVRQAAANGITLGLLPGSNGNTPSYVAALTDAHAGENRAYHYGYYLGRRYKGHANLIWVLGGDVSPAQDPSAIPLTRLLAIGIVAGGATQPMTFHPRGGESSSKWFTNDRWLAFNMIQQADRPSISLMVRSDGALGKPAGVGESACEGKAKAAVVRSESYRTCLSGGYYYAYGRSRNYAGRNSLPTPGIEYSRIARDLMVQRGWLNYAPDNGALMKSYRATAVASLKGRSAAMVYLLGGTASATLNLSTLNASGRVWVQRFNPTNGTVTTIGMFPDSGLQAFNTGGLSDAVILLDAAPPAHAHLTTSSLLSGTQNKGLDPSHGRA